MTARKHTQGLFAWVGRREKGEGVKQRNAADLFDTPINY